MADAFKNKKMEHPGTGFQIICQTKKKDDVNKAAGAAVSDFEAWPL